MSHPITIEFAKSDYNWQQVFDFADPRKFSPGHPSTPSIVTGLGVSDAPFSIGDVAEITHSSDGDNDGPDWLVCGRLNDGRWFLISAGCDYTGWDCQSGGYCWVAASFDEIIRSAMGDDARDRLGLTSQNQNNNEVK